LASAFFDREITVSGDPAGLGADPTATAPRAAANSAGDTRDCGASVLTTRFPGLSPKITRLATISRRFFVAQFAAPTRSTTKSSERLAIVKRRERPVSRWRVRFPSGIFRSAPT
jgi:hypothetical protein